MADNFTFTPGAGATGAADEVAGVFYPRVKIAWGVDGSAVDASATNPFPIGFPTTYFGSSGGVKVEVVAGASSETTWSAGNVAQIGATNETAATSDTATAGLNGLFKRALAHLTTLNSRLPSALTVGGNLKVSIAEGASSAGTPATRSTDIISVVTIAHPQNTGATNSRIVTAASNNATNLKTTGGNVLGIHVKNIHATNTFFLKLYNKVSAPAPATDNALLVWVIELKAGEGFSERFDPPLSFPAGIGYAIVRNSSDTDNTSITVGEAHGLIQWI